MYQIAICDDEQVFCQQLSRFCKEICAQLRITTQITAFQDASSLLAAMTSNQAVYHLLLLDILMDGLNGMELCKKIQDLGSEATVIFVTAAHDYAIDCYRFHPFDFLVKPIDRARLKQSIAEDYRKRFSNGAVTLEVDRNWVRVSHQEIYMLETVGREVAVHLQEQILHVDGTLGKLLQQLPEETFVRCHQSFAVNIEHVKELTPQHFVCTNGKRAQISRAYRKAAQAAFLAELTRSC